MSVTSHLNKVKKIYRNYITMNHHKERDFRIAVQKEYSLLDSEPQYFAIFPDPYVVSQPEDVYTWASEELAVLDLLLSVLASERRYCFRVLKKQDEHDSVEIKQAKYYESIEKILIKERTWLDCHYDYINHYFEKETLTLKTSSFFGLLDI